MLSLLLAALTAVACQPDASRRGATVLFASGADLQSINPLLTLHPLARQVQRYVLLTTLARYDSTLTPRPYLARTWEWSDGDRTLTLHLHTEARWHDGRPTTARDVAWTLTAALDPATGYPRLSELADLVS
ncbi:MAG TPA: ABC transporter substrate-binding protein, partial [Gemmatimonadales bacterium]|nr:ABC transporter substrate-binding protein [Gemmatimonadales bacterium]